MRLNVRRTLPALLASCAAVVASLAVSASPAHAAPAIAIEFYADSGDTCSPVATNPVPYGVTEGALTWNLLGGPASYSWVHLGGTLTDRPTVSGTVDCRDDGRYSFATFIGWSGPNEVAVQQVKADNATVPFDFNLGGPSSTGTVQRVDRVTIQVCRAPNVTEPYVYCGQEVTYLVPPIV